MEVLALKEESMHLRESNVGLRERAVEERREVEELAKMREAMADEVKRLASERLEIQEQKCAEVKELERQTEGMKEKLARCRDAVAFAVGSIDELYVKQDNESVRLSTSGHAQGDSPVAVEDFHDVKAQLKEADDEVVQLLTTLSEGDVDQENTSAAQILTKKAQEPAPRERTPLRACN